MCVLSLQTFFRSGMILLVNLLIAMMANTYSRIYMMSGKEALFARTEMVYSIDRSDKIMPPPLNMFVHLSFHFIQY